MFNLDGLSNSDFKFSRQNNVFSGRLQPISADQTHRNDGDSGAQCSPSDAGAATVEATISTSGAFRVDTNAVAIPNKVDELFQRCNRCGVVATFNRDGAH